MEDSRRKFISKSALASFSILVGAQIVFGEKMPENIEPLGLNDPETDKAVPGKNSELNILNSKPWSAETPPHLLDPKVTPANLMFVRNNGIPPSEFDLDKWTFTIDGESVKEKMSFTLKELKEGFTQYSYHLTLECGGNGRGEFNPSAKGNQWGLGAVACTKWTGVRLKDILNKVGIKDNAVYIGYYGADSHLSGDKNKDSISRER